MRRILLIGLEYETLHFNGLAHVVHVGVLNQAHPELNVFWICGPERCPQIRKTTIPKTLIRHIPLTGGISLSDPARRSWLIATRH